MPVDALPFDGIVLKDNLNEHCVGISRRGSCRVVLFGASNVAFAETMRVGGVGAAMGMLPHLFAAFDRSEAIKLVVIPSLGTSGGLRALSEGVLDMAMSGRALTPAELAQGLTPRLEVRTPFLLVTSHPSSEWSREHRGRRHLQAAKPTWADGSPIRIILRPKSDSDTVVLGGLFPDMAAAIEAGAQAPGFVDCRYGPGQCGVWRNACLDL